LLAMLHASKEFMWWIHLFEKLKFDLDQKMIIYNDNLQTIRLFISKIAKMNIKLRHVDITQCWLRQSIQQGKIDVEYISIQLIWWQMKWSSCCSRKDISNSFNSWDW
jgi:hypothetical protein